MTMQKIDLRMKAIFYETSLIVLRFFSVVFTNEKLGFPRDAVVRA